MKKRTKKATASGEGNTVLLVWEMIPDSNDTHLLTGLDDETFEKLKKCHRRFGGLVTCPEEVEEFLGSDTLAKLMTDETQIGENEAPSLPCGVTLVITGWVM